MVDHPSTAILARCGRLCSCIDTSPDAYIAILERFPAYFLVAESDGQLVGYIHASVQRETPVEVIPAHEPYVAIEDIYVQPDYRDIGGALLERIFEFARQEGIQHFI